MKISFKGFENTGIGVEVNKNRQQLLKNNQYYIKPKYVHFTLTTTLNNKNERDLEDFKEILEKFPNYHDKDTINFHYDKYEIPSLRTKKAEFWLNDKPLILNDDNLRIFSKIAQLISKLSKTPDEKFHLKDKYLLSDECKINFNYFKKDKRGFADKVKIFHTPANIRQNAKNMKEEIELIISRYMEI